MALGLTRVE